MAELSELLSSRFTQLHQMSPTQPLSMKQAAKVLGFGEGRSAARRLTYLLRKREANTGEKIIQGGGGKGRKQFVTLASIRNSYSDLVDDGHYLSVIVRELQRWVSERLDAHREYQRSLGFRIADLQYQINALKSKSRTSP